MNLQGGQLDRNQALVNSLVAQRDAALNAAANLSADLEVARGEIADAKTRIAALEAQLRVAGVPQVV